ncbi:MAG: hypothetical protein FWF54_03005 [Candidatus Azobacteroides sp.]|jgi:hypothetical protein|nr:hypothetical protein [Candidatus Azobacteroides sp.]
MKKMITNDENPVTDKKNSTPNPQKSTLDFLKSFARIYHSANTKQIQNQSYFLN